MGTFPIVWLAFVPELTFRSIYLLYTAYQSYIMHHAYKSIQIVQVFVYKWLMENLYIGIAGQ